MRAAIAISLFALSTLAFAAQSPYAGWQNRGIKALSDQQIDDLRQGRGMSLALPAELNGYPGPKHILELEPQLHLSSSQKQAIDQAFSNMQAEAQAAGLRVLEAERQLEALFVTRTADAVTLATQVRLAGERWSELRNIHLKYHLQMVELLNADQRLRYQQLRGYQSSGHSHTGHGH